MSENTSTLNQQPPLPSNESQLALIVYVLQAVSFLFGVTFFIAIIINYIKRGDLTNDVVKSHFAWQIRTFWWVLGLGIVGSVLSVIGIGFLILVGVAIWYIYRIVKGCVRLNDRKPI